MIWGMFCGFVAGMACFSIIAGVYISFPLSMSSWEAVVWGVGLVFAMQLVALVRRLYVYI
jgi:hypothetical protein